LKKKIVLLDHWVEIHKKNGAMQNFICALNETYSNNRKGKEWEANFVYSPISIYKSLSALDWIFKKDLMEKVLGKKAIEPDDFKQLLGDNIKLKTNYINSNANEALLDNIELAKLRDILEESRTETFRVKTKLLTPDPCKEGEVLSMIVSLLEFSGEFDRDSMMSFSGGKIGTYHRVGFKNDPDVQAFFIESESVNSLDKKLRGMCIENHKDFLKKISTKIDDGGKKSSEDFTIPEFSISMHDEISREMKEMGFGEFFEREKVTEIDKIYHAIKLDVTPKRVNIGSFGQMIEEMEDESKTTCENIKVSTKQTKPFIFILGVKSIPIVICNMRSGASEFSIENTFYQSQKETRAAPFTDLLTPSESEVEMFNRLRGLDMSLFGGNWKAQEAFLLETVLGDKVIPVDAGLFPDSAGSKVSLPNTVRGRFPWRLKFIVNYMNQQVPDPMKMVALDHVMKALRMNPWPHYNEGVQSDMLNKWMRARALELGFPKWEYEDGIALSQYDPDKVPGRLGFLEEKAHREFFEKVKSKSDVGDTKALEYLERIAGAPGDPYPERPTTAYDVYLQLINSPFVLDRSIGPVLYNAPKGLMDRLSKEFTAKYPKLPKPPPFPKKLFKYYKNVWPNKETLDPSVVQHPTSGGGGEGGDKILDKIRTHVGPYTTFDAYKKSLIEVFDEVDEEWFLENWFPVYRIYAKNYDMEQAIPVFDLLDNTVKRPTRVKTKEDLMLFIKEKLPNLKDDDLKKSIDVVTSYANTRFSTGQIKTDGPGFRYYPGIGVRVVPRVMFKSRRRKIKGGRRSRRGRRKQKRTFGVNEDLKECKEELSEKKSNVKKLLEKLHQFKLEETKKIELYEQEIEAKSEKIELQKKSIDEHSEVFDACTDEISKHEDFLVDQKEYIEDIERDLSEAEEKVDDLEKEKQDMIETINKLKSKYHLSKETPPSKEEALKKYARKYSFLNVMDQNDAMDHATYLWNQYMKQFEALLQI